MLAIVREIDRITREEIDSILEIWYESAKNTYDHLLEEDFQDLMPMVEVGVRDSDNIIVIEKEEEIKGFLLLDEEIIDMLFIKADSRHKGYGRKLVEFVIDKYDIRYASVNEENEEAIKFYQDIGFVHEEKGEQDHLGRVYPMLTLMRK